MLQPKMPDVQSSALGVAGVLARPLGSVDGGTKSAYWQVCPQTEATSATQREFHFVLQQYASCWQTCATQGSHEASSLAPAEHAAWAQLGGGGGGGGGPASVVGPPEPVAMQRPARFDHSS
jgi:hypothetical protein